MIQTVIDRLTTDLQALNFVDTAVGIVRPQREVVGTKDNNTVKIYPVYINKNKTTCSASDYIDLLPNDKKKGIIYFEDKGTTMNEDANYYRFSSQVQLVAWFNLKRINTTMLNADLLRLKVANTIPRTLANSGGISGITFELTGNIKEPSIFGDYTITEERKQPFMYPFDYFALNYVVEYKIHRSCINDITIKGTECY